MTPGIASSVHIVSYVVEQAVKEAVAAGYDPEVIDLISLKPFDQSAIAVRGSADWPPVLHNTC